MDPPGPRLSRLPSPRLSGLILGICLIAVASMRAGVFTTGGQQPPLNFALDNNLTCEVCHGDYDLRADYEAYPTWAGSMMAQAARDPLFWASLDVANNDVPGIGEWCLRCHSPRAYLAGRLEPPLGSADGCGLEGNLDEEGNDFDGIACSTCHRMTINPSPPPAEPNVYLENGQFWIEDTSCRGSGPPCRLGPYDYPLGQNPPFHPWRHSDYHEESTFCGNCHNVTSPAHNLIVAGVDTGVPFPIERTHREWQQSEYAVAGPGQTTCQNCHMPDPEVVPAYAAVTQDNDHTGDVPAHNLAGGNAWIPDIIRQEYPNLGRDAELAATRDRALAMLQTRAAVAAITVPAVVNAGQNLDVSVRVTNLSGHKLPTGYPEGRRLWLNAWARDGLGQLIWESGAYDPVTAVLTEDAQVKVYEAKPGIWNLNATNQCDIADGTSRPIFHFALNDCYVIDNRIPPLGFTGMNDLETQPRAYVYPETTPGSGILVNYDTTDYTFPVPPGTRGPVTVGVALRYQTSSREYIEFLRDQAVENNFPDDCLPRTTGMPTQSRGEYMWDLWDRYGRSGPVEMTAAVGGAGVIDTNCPTLPDAASRLLAVRLPAARDDVALSWDAAPGATTHSAYRVLSDPSASNRDLIVVASAIGAAASSSIEEVTGCRDVAALACVDVASVSSPTDLVFYEVRGACANGSEGVH